MTTLLAIPGRMVAARDRRPTPIRRHRWQRDAVILLAARHGAGAAFLAEAFDLDVSTVRKVLRRFGHRPGRPDAAR